MRALVVIAFALLLSGAAHAQRPPAAPAVPVPPPAALPPQAPNPAPPPAAPARSCQSQHIEQPGVSAAALIGRGYDIKAAIPGGLWIQKDREVYFCNSGLALDSDVLCWRLREPVKGQAC
ncbi:hypothetical protein BH11PSE3_BH11PSE3_40810 [soil metagenome]